MRFTAWGLRFSLGLTGLLLGNEFFKLKTDYLLQNPITVTYMKFLPRIQFRVWVQPCATLEPLLLNIPQDRQFVLSHRPFEPIKSLSSSATAYYEQ